MIFLAVTLAIFSFVVCVFCMKFMKTAGLGVALLVAVIAGHHLSIVEALGRAKPYSVEFRDLDGADVIAFEVEQDEILVWLKVDGRPIVYSLKYSETRVANLYAATREAGEDNRAKVTRTDEPIGDLDEDLMFHPAPVEPLEAK
jgi:hypothetical protein